LKRFHVAAPAENAALAIGHMPNHVMPGLVPGIHAQHGQRLRLVDGRDKPGHDAERICHIINRIAISSDNRA
jgi:hypothetical protein